MRPGDQVAVQAPSGKARRAVVEEVEESGRLRLRFLTRWLDGGGAPVPGDRVLVDGQPAEVRAAGAVGRATARIAAQPIGAESWEDWWA